MPLPSHPVRTGHDLFLKGGIQNTFDKVSPVVLQAIICNQWLRTEPLFIPAACYCRHGFVYKLSGFKQTLLCGEVDTQWVPLQVWTKCKAYQKPIQFATSVTKNRHLWINQMLECSFSDGFSSDCYLGLCLNLHFSHRLNWGPISAIW